MPRKRSWWLILEIAALPFSSNRQMVATMEMSSETVLGILLTLTLKHGMQRGPHYIQIVS